MRLTIARRYFWVGHTCVSACVCVCKSTNRFDFDPDTATRQRQIQRQRQRLRLRQRQCHRKVEVEDEVDVEVEVAVRVNDCTMQMRNEETNFTTCLTAVCLSIRPSVCPSVGLSVELLCLFICLARSSLPHAVARHPCPALPCPALLRTGWLSKFGVSDCVSVWAECIITCAVSNANKTFAPAIKPCDDFALPSLLARTAQRSRLNP